MPVNATVVGIEVVGVPLKRGIVGTLRVSSAFIPLHRQDVLFVPEVNGAGDVQAVGCHPVLVKPNLLAIQEDISGLPHALELEKDFAAGKLGRKLEVFAVPGQPFVSAAVATAMGNDLTK